MSAQDQHEGKPWGAKLNRSIWHEVKDYPAWANRAQQERRQEKGLIVWDHETEQIVRLHAVQALQLLDYMRTDEHWDQRDAVVGDPPTVIVLDDSKPEPKQMLLSKVALSPGRLRELRELLERSRPVLERMKEEDEAERDPCLAKVYGLLIELACQENSQKEAADAELDKS